jgi:hypothetical protein
LWHFQKFNIIHSLLSMWHFMTTATFEELIRRTVAAVEISDRKDSNTLYKFRNLISVNRIFIKDYKVSVSIWHIRAESRVTFEMPQLSDLQKCIWLRDGVSIRAIAREINVDNVWVTFWETSLSIPFTKPKVWRCQSVWVFNGRNCTYYLVKNKLLPIFRTFREITFFMLCN